MKRDQVFRALRPFQDAGIELDIVQLTPSASTTPSPTTCLTDLPTSVGIRSGRSAEVGGRDLDGHRHDRPGGHQRLSRLAAEHSDGRQPLHQAADQGTEADVRQGGASEAKRRQAEDPKAVFQAMRPVFNDLVQELQRSIGYFRSIDRRARSRMASSWAMRCVYPACNRTSKRTWRSPSRRVQEFEHLTGSSVISTPKFKDNLLSFAVSYGLCIQGLGKGRLSTNLIPRELVTSRLIRHKKPWACWH